MDERDESDCRTIGLNHPPLKRSEMPSILVRLTRPIAGLDRHFTAYQLGELTVFTKKLKEGREWAEADGKATDGYREDITRVVDILNASANYSYIEVDGTIADVVGLPGPGWNRVLRLKETDHPLQEMGVELRLAAEFVTLENFDLASVDWMDYAGGVSRREFYLPDQAVDALEVVAY
ncbi:hypothetical protein [Rhodococcus erythropolis]|uniref:Uncharacterized protein n=1 Tax=Rhodococcus erythropolis TaxID=1833 RepID=A0AAX3ZZH2_RHOER|nr:hypothetical protein [Rhodococcus erythropolis]WMN02198.1 hypothetical protein QIE55_33260 [Rhodococcus erythropolis]